MGKTYKERQSVADGVRPRPPQRKRGNLREAVAYPGYDAEPTKPSRARSRDFTGRK